MYKKLVAGIILALFICSSASAAGVVVKIRAVNPLDEEAAATAKAYLPKGIKPKNIIDKGDFLVKFDKEKRQYFVAQEIMLDPKQVMVFEVELEDVWVVPEKKIALLRSKAKRISKRVLAPLLSISHNNMQYETVKALKNEIVKNLDKIIQKQEHNTIARVGVERHIEAYEENVETVEQVKTDLKMLKNLNKRRRHK